MADPLLDEDNIVALLQVPIKPEAVGRIQTGAMQALLDIYDRKVTRDEFIAMASPCVALYGSASKMWMLDNVSTAHETTGLDKAAFDHASASLENLIRVQSEAVIEIVKRLQMCPTSADRIN